MISLSEKQLDILMRAAEPLLPGDRVAYLQRVAQLLHHQPELGDGLVSRCARQGQKEFWRPQDLSRAKDGSKYRA